MSYDFTICCNIYFLLSPAAVLLFVLKDDFLSIVVSFYVFCGLAFIILLFIKV